MGMILKEHPGILCGGKWGKTFEAEGPTWVKASISEGELGIWRVGHSWWYKEGEEMQWK